MITMNWLVKNFPDMVTYVTDRKKTVVVDMNTYPYNYNLKIIITKKGGK